LVYICCQKFSLSRVPTLFHISKLIQKLTQVEKDNIIEKETKMEKKSGKEYKKGIGTRKRNRN
jgi:hypothetical protein